MSQPVKPGRGEDGSHGNTPSGASSNPPPSLTGTVAELASAKTHRVQNALVLIRTRFLKEKDGITRLRQRGGLPKLIHILQGTNEKLIDISLSILGNCCMEQKTRLEILYLGGIRKIGKLLETTQVPSIQNRVCRTLGNLALDPDCCTAIHNIHENEGVELEDPLVPKKVVKLLRETTDQECQLTYLRTLRLLADTKDHEAAVLEEAVLKSAAEILKSEDLSISLILAALKVVNHFTKQVTDEHCRQLVGGDFSNSLMQHSSHTDPNISQSAQSLILTLIKFEPLRPPFGAAGAVTFLLGKAQDSELPRRLRFSHINALCLCCRESVNRIKIRESGTLVEMVKWLGDEECSPIHYRIISSLVCFLYDDVGLDLLLKNGIVPTLVRHLRSCANIPESTETSTSLVDVADDEDCDSMEDCLLIVPPSVEDPLQLDVDHEKSVCHEKWDLEEGPDAEECFPKEEDIDRPESGDAKPAISTPPIHESQPTKRAPVKYSIDSPTYKEMAESRCEDDTYQSGPRNIMESAMYYSHGLSSPEKLSPYHTPHHGGSYSPLSVSSYLSSDWSPEVSPASSPAHGSQSPPISPSSSSQEGPFSNSAGPSMTLPQWLSSQGSSPSASQWSNVSYVSPMSSPPHPQMSPLIYRSHSSPSLWSPLQAQDVHFSSEEEDEDEDGATFQVGEADEVQAPALDEAMFPSATTIFDAAAVDAEPATEPAEQAEPQPVCPSTSDASAGEGRKRKRSSTCTDERKSLKTDAPSASTTKDPSSPDVEKTEGELSKIKGPRKVTEYNILVLLFRISCLDDPTQHLCSRLVWTTLLEYARRARDPIHRGARILVRLAKNPCCFRTLILNTVPELIDRVLSPTGIQTEATPSECHVNDTRQLRDQLFGSLSIVAESRYGRGTLTNMMLRGSGAAQMSCAVSLPYICRSRSLREDMLNGCGALDVLVEALFQRHQDHNSYALEVFIHSIHHLALKLDLALHGPRTAGSKTPQKLNTPSQKLNTPSREHDLTFVMDDGNLVKGHRVSLVSRSTVFKAMLEGHYSESDQSQITIQGVCSDTFQVFLDWVCRDDTTPATPEMSLETSLEVLALCNQYMVVDRQQEVSEYICEQVLRPDTVVQVVEFALLHNSPWLVRQGLCYVLSEDSVSMQSRLKCIKELVASQQHQCVIKELKSILS